MERRGKTVDEGGEMREGKEGREGGEEGRGEEGRGEEGGDEGRERKHNADSVIVGGRGEREWRRGVRGKGDIGGVRGGRGEREWR